MMAKKMRSICLTLLAGTGVLALGVEPARAGGPCSNTSFFGQFVPDCQNQQQPTLSFDSIFSSGYAFYCSGDHPFFYGLLADYSNSFTWDNSCFTVTENLFFEHIHHNSKFDATISNFCSSQEEITVTLACSSKDPG
jgi:hypothetical protein